MIEEISINAALEMRGSVVRPLESLGIVFLFFAEVVERREDVLFGLRWLDVEASHN